MTYTRAQAQRDVENAFELFELYGDDPDFRVPLVPMSFCAEGDVAGEHFSTKQLQLLLDLIAVQLGISREQILSTPLSDEPTELPHPENPDIALYGELDHRRAVFFLARSS
jgi:hypothetical protein